MGNIMINISNLKTTLRNEETETIRYMIESREMSPIKVANKMKISEVTIHARLRKFKSLGMVTEHSFNFGKLGYKGKAIVIVRSGLEEIKDTGILMEAEKFNSCIKIEAYIWNKEEETLLNDVISKADVIYYDYKLI